jgi:hypothetical protein
VIGGLDISTFVEQPELFGDEAIIQVKLSVHNRPSRRIDIGDSVERHRARGKNPWYLFGVAGFAVAGAIGATLALHSAIPGGEASAREIGALAALAGASALLLLIIIGIETRRVANPTTVSAPPIRSVSADRAALKAG